MDAKALERGANLLQHQLDADARELVGVLVCRARDPLCQLGDVVAAVAVLGRLLATRTRADRRAEVENLRAVVVDVVLALDAVARELEQA